jgi:predicted  nucleic acid-binding Zn-ribbon protein
MRRHMLPALTQLLQVQERDQRILKFQKDLKDIPLHQARARTQLAGDQAAVEKATQVVKETEVKIKSIELDIQTRQNTIKRLQDQQFETRKNDEFAALGHEIQRYQGDVRTLEDSELEQMEALEAAKAGLKTAQDKLAETQARVNDELKALDERATGIQARLTEIQKERGELAAPVDPDPLELYTRIFSKKSDAVVAIENGVCGGCHVKVVSSTIQSLRQGTSITQCDSCGRIVYLIE